MNRVILAARGISKTYPGGIRALDGVDFELREGEVHALLGENGAGKSTLAKILYGLVYPDRGVVEYRGRRVELLSPRDALSLGILYVPQYPLLPRGLTVAEVVELYAEARGFRGEPVSAVKGAAENLGWSIDFDADADSLGLVERQRLFLSLALGLGFEVLILDEPTSFLSGVEVERLLERIEDVKGRVSIVYITHRIGEVRRIADRVTVLREGRVVARIDDPSSVSDEELVSLVARKRGLSAIGRRGGRRGRVVLRVEGLRVRRDDGRLAVDNVSFEVREGEVVAIVGIEGMGQRELLEAIAGLRRPESGRVVLDGVVVDDVRVFRLAGGRFVPGERLEALAADMTVLENIVSPLHAARIVFDKLVLRVSRALSLASRVVDEYGIVGGPRSRVGELSGGNQQKVLLGREMGVEGLKLLVMHNPTAGLDVASSRLVLEKIAGLADRGVAVLFSTPFIEEAALVADRILAWRGGRVAAVFERGTPVEEIAKAILA